VELTDGCYSEGDSQGLPGFIYPRVLGISTISFPKKLYSQTKRHITNPSLKQSQKQMCMHLQMCMNLQMGIKMVAENVRAFVTEKEQ